MSKKKYIGWRRVSTFKQNRSGLGLEAQKEIIRYFIERDGGELIADYSECYTGKELSGCTELRKAMAHAKKEEAILIIAKSDRFRNTIEALQIYEEMGDGHIMFCDLPRTDKFTLTLFFALAEREALLVSIRTKQALAVKKSQGCKLGAASDKYRMRANAKSEEAKAEEAIRRGNTARAKHQASRDTAVLLKVFRRVYADYCKDDNPARWRWAYVTTAKAKRVEALSLLRDYKEMDGTGELLRSWDLTGDLASTRLQTKLANSITSLRRSFVTY